MPQTRFHIVDVFDRGRYTGNQLAVFRDAGSLDDDEMAALAREMNYSETTYIESAEPREGGYDVRIFDPVEELEFAGHPTLGTAFVISEFVRDDRPDEVDLNLGVGRITVTVEESPDGEQFWMRQIPPRFGETLERSTIAAVVGLAVDDIDDRYPVQLVSTGLQTAVVPVVSLDAVRRADTDPERFERAIVDPHGITNVLVFAPEGIDGNDLHARVFCDWSSIPEDPATGSSNGCLAAWLIEHEFFETDRVAVTVGQGYELGRPSRLHLRAQRTDGDIAVSVGGTVRPVADGRLV